MLKVLITLVLVSTAAVAGDATEILLGQVSASHVRGYNQIDDRLSIDFHSEEVSALVSFEREVHRCHGRRDLDNCYSQTKVLKRVRLPIEGLRLEGNDLVFDTQAS